MHAHREREREVGKGLTGKAGTHVAQNFPHDEAAAVPCTARCSRGVAERRSLAVLMAPSAGGSWRRSDGI